MRKTTVTYDIGETDNLLDYERGLYYDFSYFLTVAITLVQKGANPNVTKCNLLHSVIKDNSLKKHSYGELDRRIITLIQCGVNINVKNKSGCLPLRKYLVCLKKNKELINNHLNTINALINAETDLTQLKYPFHIVMLVQDKDIKKQLLVKLEQWKCNSKFSKRKHDELGDLLQMAITLNDTDMIGFLIRNGIDFSGYENNKKLRTLYIDYLCKTGEFSLAHQVAVQKLIDPEQLTQNEYSLHFAVLRQDDVGLYACLAKSNITENINEAHPESKVTPLALAAQLGYKNGVEYLLNKGADVLQSTPGPSKSPLFLAAENKHLDICLLLLKTIDRIPDECLPQLGNLVTVAAAYDCLDILICLRQKVSSDSLKALLNPKNKCLSPLSEAARRGHYGMVQWMLDKGAEINEDVNQYYDGKTPLYWAVVNGHLEVIELLIRNNASFDVLDFNRNRCSFMQYILSSTPHFPDDVLAAKGLVTFITKKPDFIQVRGSTGDTFLHWMLRSNFYLGEQIYYFIYQLKVNAVAINNNKQTILDVGLDTFLKAGKEDKLSCCRNIMAFLVFAKPYMTDKTILSRIEKVKGLKETMMEVLEQMVKQEVLTDCDHEIYSAFMNKENWFSKNLLSENQRNKIFAIVKQQQLEINRRSNTQRQSEIHQNFCDDDFESVAEEMFDGKGKDSKVVTNDSQSTEAVTMQKPSAPSFLSDETQGLFPNLKNLLGRQLPAENPELQGQGSTNVNAETKSVEARKASNPKEKNLPLAQEEETKEAMQEDKVKASTGSLAHNPSNVWNESSLKFPQVPTHSLPVSTKKEERKRCQNMLENA